MEKGDILSSTCTNLCISTENAEGRAFVLEHGPACIASEPRDLDGSTLSAKPSDFHRDFKRKIWHRVLHLSFDTARLILTPLQPVVVHGASFVENVLVLPRLFGLHPCPGALVLASSHIQGEM